METGEKPRPCFGMAALACLAVALLTPIVTYFIIRSDLATAQPPGGDLVILIGIAIKILFALLVVGMTGFGAMTLGGVSVVRKESSGWAGLLALVLGGFLVLVILGMASVFLPAGRKLPPASGPVNVASPVPAPVPPAGP